MPGCAYSEVSKERKALERGIAMYRNRYDDNCEYDDYDSYRGFDEPKAGQDCGCRCDRDFDDNRSAEDEQGFAQEYYNCNSDGGSACDCGCDCNRPPRPPRPYPGIGPVSYTHLQTSIPTKAAVNRFLNEQCCHLILK